MADTCCLDCHFNPYPPEICSHGFQQISVTGYKRRLHAVHPIPPARRFKPNSHPTYDALLPSPSCCIAIDRQSNVVDNNNSRSSSSSSSSSTNNFSCEVAAPSTQHRCQQMEAVQRQWTHSRDNIRIESNDNQADLFLGNDQTYQPMQNQSSWPRSPSLRVQQSSVHNHSPDPGHTHISIPFLLDLVPQPLPSPAAILSARAILATTSIAQPVIDSSYHRDAWPVDDPRHCYDFADFMEHWRQQSSSSGGALPANSGQGNVLKAREVIDGQISQSSLSSAIDMQGLAWVAPAPSREDAFIARRMLHPVYSSASTPSQMPTAPKSSPSQTATASASASAYMFRNYSSQHRAKLSHHQLRHLLAASGRHHVFYAQKNKVWQTSLACPNLRQPVTRWPKYPEQSGGFKITCLSTLPSNVHPECLSHNVLLAGGARGEFAVWDLTDVNNARHVEGNLTSAHNGLVTHVHTFHQRQSGLPQASFCSNDAKVRLMDVQTCRIQNVFSYDEPVNCVTTSPDGRLRVLVGDSKDALITDADSGEALVTLRQHRDYAFSCAWSPDGRYVATGAEDNCVVLWDARHWAKPVAVQPTSISCPRSLHFTHSGALVVAEEEDTVSVYDSGSLDHRQDLRFFGSIAGVALIDGGEEIVVANCDNTVGGLLTFEKRRSCCNSLTEYRRRGRGKHG